MYRVTTCLENKKCHGFQSKIWEISRKCQGENLIGENCPKTFQKIAPTGFLVSLT